MDHIRERFIPWLAVITADSQEGQMFERRWRGKILNQFFYVSTADTERSRGTLVIRFFLRLPCSPPPASTHVNPFLRLSLSIRLSAFFSFCTLPPAPYSSLSSSPFTSSFLFSSLSRSLSPYLSMGFSRIKDWTWKRDGQSYSCSLAGAHLPPARLACSLRKKVTFVCKFTDLFWLPRRNNGAIRHHFTTNIVRANLLMRY